MSFRFRKNQIPNLLTLSRLFFIPIILVFLFVNLDIVIYEFRWLASLTVIKLNWLLAGLFFCLLSFTDFLDGFLARKFNWVSDFGKIWDPVADKILINSVLISFSIHALVPWYLTILMLSRDIIVDSYRMYAATQSIIVKANLFGKLKTFFQMFSIIIIFFIFNTNKTKPIVDYFLVQNLLVFIATFVSIASGVYYLLCIKRKLNKKFDIIDKV